MKERFWKTYYYVMWFLALFGLYVLFDSGFAPFPFFNGNDEEKLNEFQRIFDQIHERIKKEFLNT